jgi:hypothetical protein
MVALVFTSCDKDKNKEETSKAESIDLTKLPVFYNGVAMNCLMESFVKPATKNADMEEIILINEEALYIFDVNAAFYEHCNELESLFIYETTKKLDSIYEKAVELGLTEMEIEMMPEEMTQYWAHIFKDEPPTPNRNLLGRLFKQQNYEPEGNYYGYQPLFWWSFGSSYNNAARSIRIWGFLHTGWLCTKKWFGGPRLVYFCATTKWYPTLPAGYDKNLCSSIGF